MYAVNAHATGLDLTNQLVEGVELHLGPDVGENHQPEVAAVEILSVIVQDPRFDGLGLHIGVRRVPPHRHGHLVDSSVGPVVHAGKSGIDARRAILCEVEYHNFIGRQRAAVLAT